MQTTANLQREGRLKLSILIPVYNERETLEEIVRQVRAVQIEGFDKEIIAVDDGSSDGSRDILQKLAEAPDFRAYYHDVNQGKGGSHSDGDRPGRR